MPRIEGKIVGEGLCFAVLVSRFNGMVTNQLVQGAIETLKRYGVVDDQIHVFYVPGVMEIVPLAKKLAFTKKYDAILCLGAVIRGETSHFEYIAASSAQGIVSVGLQSDVPLLYGILTTNTLEDALERSGGKLGNKGADVALAGIEMAQLYKILDT